MGLYSSYDPSEFYDTSSKREGTKKKDYKQPHQIADNMSLTNQKRKSLYEEAQKIRSGEIKNPNLDFRKLYRVGQLIMVQSKNGVIRTRRGRIVEIVDKDLMYVGMEDTYKDVNDHWLVDFVTGTDKITKI